MRKSHLLLFAGALTLAGTAAFAAGNQVHQMTVQIPGGGVAQIEYTGNVAPKVTIGPAQKMPAMMPMAFGFAGFPDFARIQADMDRQMQQMDAQMGAMLNQAQAMMAMPDNGAIEAGFGTAPKGAYFCAQSVHITTDANGKQNIERHSSGNCGGRSDKNAVQHAPAAEHHGDTI